MARCPSIAAALALALAVPAAASATTQAAPRSGVHWSFEGPLGMYDQAQLQRGYKVYREVCSSCHSMNFVAFRNLGDPGGPFFNPKYPNPNDNPVVKAIAADYQIADIDSDTGETIKRPGTSADYFPNPYANPTAGKAANGGALPPDMSLLAKARENGPDYIYSIVTGDNANIPAGLTLPPGKYYDPYIAGDLTPYWHGDPNRVPRGGLIAMPPPLAPGKVQFDDGTRSSVSEEAWDVAAFLEWAADPKMEQRKELGVSVLIFLVLFSGLLWVTYRNLWRDIGH